MSSNPNTLTVPEVRAWFVGHGKLFSDVGRAFGVNRHYMQKAFDGRIKGRRGKAYELKVALRLIPPPTDAKHKDFALPPPKAVRQWIAENGIDLSQYEKGKA